MRLRPRLPPVRPERQLSAADRSSRVSCVPPAPLASAQRRACPSAKTKRIGGTSIDLGQRRGQLDELDRADPAARRALAPEPTMMISRSYRERAKLLGGDYHFCDVAGRVRG